MNRSLVLILPALLALPAWAEDVDVYLLAGQSNMQGLGQVAELPDPWQAVHEDVLFWNGEAFEALDPAGTRISSRAGEFGPELGFIHGLREAGQNQPLHLIKFHRSGQPLHHGWNGNRWAGAEPGPGRHSFYPGTEAEDPNIGRHYQAWLRQCRAAMAAIEAEGDTPIIRGVIWMQGEQDSKHELSATRYAESLRHLRTRLGQDLEAPDLPWVYGQVLPHEPALERFTHRTEIRAAMAALDARSGTEDATPGMWMVSTDDMPLLPDTVHYDTEGQQMLGQAFAEAMQGLQSAQEAATERPVRVACIGDSITFGAGVQNRQQNHYPAQLERLLGESYDVENFGISGTTLLETGANWAQRRLDDVLAWQPEVIVIALGTNDTKPNNWDAQGDQFALQYAELIAALRALPSAPEIHLCLPAPIVRNMGQGGNEIRQAVMQAQVRPLVRQVATDNACGLIDLHAALGDHPELIPDGVHPNAEGAGLIAAAVATHLQGPQPAALADDWEYVDIAINEPGYHVWGSSPIMDDDGRVHLFAARWPIEARFVPGWHTACEIAHYVGPGPEGPFEFVEVVAEGTGEAGDWNRQGIHNPNIQRVGDRYALTFIGNTGERFPASQTIGMLVADSLEGPWLPVGAEEGGPLLSPPEDEGIWCHSSGCGVNNPALLAHPDGRFLLYFKAKPGPNGHTRMGVAMADQLEGPYVIQPEPITANDRHIEDGYAFLWRDHVCLMTTDNHGMLERGGGLLWHSENGLQFDGTPLAGFHHFGNHYHPGGVPDTARAHYTRQVKFERPQVLMIDGEPTYLYVPCGVAIDGSDGTNSHILRRRTGATGND